MKKKTVLRFLGIFYAVFVFAIIFLELTAIQVKVDQCAVIETPFASQPILKKNGKRYVYPWQEVHIYEMRQDLRLEIDVLDLENNEMKISIATSFMPSTWESLGELHKKFGPTYLSNFVEPYLVRATKLHVSNYTAEEIWLTNRSEFEATLSTEIRSELARNYIDLKSFLILSIELPSSLEESLRKKIESSK